MDCSNVANECCAVGMLANKCFENEVEVNLQEKTCYNIER